MDNKPLLVRLVVIITFLTATCIILVLTEGKYAGRTAKQWYDAFAELKVRHNALESCLNNADVKMQEMKQTTTSVPCLRY